MSEKRITGRYFWAIMYPENMVEGWEENISMILQKPFAYCIHDKDLVKEDRKEERKKHVHIIIAWNNTTTKANALTLFQKLNAEGKQAIAFGGEIEKCDDVLWCWNYLIHDTEDSKKKGKYQYDKKERIVGNNFDIGSYTQLSTHDKNQMIKELCDTIIKNAFVNYIEFYMYVFLSFFFSIFFY